MIISVTVAVVWFDVPIRGSIVLLFFCTLIYLLSILGIGLLISTISKTQQQAMMAAFLFNMPTILLSGFMFPIQNMPEAVQYATLGNPLRYYLVIIREIFLKGSGLDTLWPQITALFVLGVLIFTVSALRFKRRIE
jgi:ABC-2 type transport system permease protein